ncbi:uncharacterized protein [Amphiura filiformis]|uniref:uncharacterized protein n=1 Tax=Amphiura filiformis TaxID=82378 RepID=UPI003B22011C
MAEFEEIAEIIEEADEGFEDAGEEVEDMSDEERQEFKEEVTEAKENEEELSRDATEFKKFSKVKAIKKVAVFVGKNLPIGVIFWGVNLALTKLIKIGSGDQQQSNKNKLAVIKAIIALIKAETVDSKKLLDWMKLHTDDTIILEGIEVPLEAIFHKYLIPISDAVDQASSAAKPLQKKIEGKVSWDVPNADDIAHLLNASAAFLTAFDDFRKFAISHSSEFPILQSLPLTQADIDDLSTKLDTVKKMPFY